jgi:hypothetical protein
MLFLVHKGLALASLKARLYKYFPYLYAQIPFWLPCDEILPEPILDLLVGAD